MRRESIVQMYREQLGISQQFFAEYLGIARSTLSLIELGERDLPLSALTKLRDLMQVMEQAKQFALSDDLQQTEKANLRLALQKEWDELHYQWMKQSRALEALKVAEERVYLQMQFFEYIRLQADALQVDERMQSILHLQAKQSLRKWQKNLKAQVLLQQIALESLALQKQRLEEHLAHL